MSERILVRIQQDGQVTLPVETRDREGFKSGDLVAVEQTAEGVLIKPLPITDQRVGSPWLKELYDAFAPVREEASDFSEEEINEAIDAAVKAVRQQT